MCKKYSPYILYYVRNSCPPNGPALSLSSNVSVEDCGTDNFRHATNETSPFYQLQLNTKPMLAMNFAVSSFIFSITLRVIQLSGQAELERLVRRFDSYFFKLMFLQFP